MKGKMATMKWRIAAFTEMLHFDKIIFIIFSKLILKGGRGWRGQLCREMSKARLIRKHFILSSCLSLKISKFWAASLSKHSLPLTLPTSAAQFSHAPHPSHWVTSLPSSKKPLLETCCVTGVSSVPAKGPFQVCFSQGGIQGKTSMTNRCPGEVGPGERRHASPEQSLFCWTIEKHSREFELDAAQCAVTQVLQGTGIDFVAPGWNPWGSPCKGKSKACTPGYLSVHPGRGGQVIKLKGKQS